MSEPRNRRILLMPAIIAVVALAIWLTNRPPATKPPDPAPGDPDRARKLIDQGRAALEKAMDPATRDWEGTALDAMRHFRDAITVDGGNLDAREGAARAEALVGSLAQAQDNAAFVLKRDPNRASARELYASITWRLAFRNDAHVLPRKLDRLKGTRDPAPPPDAAGLRKSVEIAFIGEPIYVALKVAEDHFRAGRLEEASRLAQAVDVRTPEAALMLGLVALEQGRDAAPFLKLAADRGLAAGRMLSARLAVATGDWETAYRYAKQVTDHAPTERWVDAWLYHGTAAKRLGKTQEAQAAFDYVRKVDPTAEEWIPKE